MADYSNLTISYPNDVRCSGLLRRVTVPFQIPSASSHWTPGLASVCGMSDHLSRILEATSTRIGCKRGRNFSLYCEGLASGDLTLSSERWLSGKLPKQPRERIREAEWSRSRQRGRYMKLLSVPMSFILEIIDKAPRVCVLGLTRTDVYVGF